MADFSTPDVKYRAGFGTDAVHAGQEPDPVTGAVIPSIGLSTTFKQDAPGETKAGMDYSRSGNPSRNNFDAAVAALEGGKFAISFSSGSACTATIINMLKAGDHILSINDVYGGTQRYFRRVAHPIGYEVDFIDMSHVEDVRKSMKPNTKIVWVESPTNPTLRLTDIEALSKIVKETPGAILVVDNTFMTPYFQNPLKLGADIVVHSVTKYINGHSDVVMGVAVTNSTEICDKLRFLQNSIGAVPSPFDCWLANRGLKTLHLRMQKHQENAIAVAKFLQSSPNCEEVIYPGLASHPQHAIAKKQMSGYGGMLSFRIKGDLSNARAFFNHIKLFALAESLGGIESLAEIPALMTHASVPEGERAKLGITDTLIRLSCGIEDTEDLVNDLKQALEKACA